MIQFPCLSIAGFDNSGGAGLQADLKVFSAFGCYGMTVLTAIAVQNTTGVKHCEMIPVSVIRQQLETIFEDIPPQAIKIGMLFNKEIINTIYDFFIVNNIKTPLIIDPVMMAKSGDPLLLPEARSSLIEKLIPLADLITPNLPEALELIGSNKNLPQEEIAQRILKLGCRAVLVKGGHYEGDHATDLFLEKEPILLSSPRIQTKNTHGTGCTLSAAITALIARQYPLIDSVRLAKKYLQKALESAKLQSVGNGAGPTDHLWFLDQACAGKLDDK
ncbi:MAG: bifunctional hydroxymethylpyrimidine kinase/phosphomethylpyrimidine kinase [Brevinema sp.]